MISMTDALAFNTMNDYKGSSKYYLMHIGLAITNVALFVLFIYDFRGSIDGFRTLNVTPLGDLMPYAIGIIPQMVQFILSPILVRAWSTNAKTFWTLAAIWLSAFVVDVGTDYFFLSQAALSIKDQFINLFIAGFVLTLFSDWFFSFTLSMQLDGFRGVFEAFGNMFRGFGERMGNTVRSAGVGEMIESPHTTLRPERKQGVSRADQYRAMEKNKRERSNARSTPKRR